MVMVMDGRRGSREIGSEKFNYGSLVENEVGNGDAIKWGESENTAWRDVVRHKKAQKILVREGKKRNFKESEARELEIDYL